MTARSLCALMLAVSFDNADPDFFPNPTRLEDLEVSQGPFKDWAVKDVIDESNSMLGGCTTNYNPIQITEVLRQINQDFLPGEAGKGFLRCANKGM